MQRLKSYYILRFVIKVAPYLSTFRALVSSKSSGTWELRGKNASVRNLRVNFHAKCKQYLKMATFLRFFRPLKTKFWNDIYIPKKGKPSLDINRSFYKISNVVKLSNNGLFRRDDVDIKVSENSGSSVKTAYLLGIGG